MAADTTSVLGVLRDMKNLTNEKTKKLICISESSIYQLKLRKPEEVVDDLNPTEDRKTSEKAHGASY